MTKAKLIDLLGLVPHDTEISIYGADFGGYDVVVGKEAILYEERDYGVVLRGVSDEMEVECMKRDKDVVRIIGRT